MALQITGIVADRSTYAPASTAQITVTVESDESEAMSTQLVLSLVALNRPVDRLATPVTIPLGCNDYTFDLILPAAAPRGYGIDVAVIADTERVLAEGSSALDVLERWSQRPRYGFLSDFAPGTDDADVVARAESLSRLHLNVIQFYDWMWRHYCLLPPEDEFEDALRRRLSLPTVRALIAAVQTRGMAAFAYGAVYGAEPEFANVHPELVLFDEVGARVSLADLFYIMNIAPDSPWTSLIVAEFAETVRVLGFDGIHLDQYGFPKTAITATGEYVDLATHFPSLIDRARAAVIVERPDAGVIFNAVGNWPIETVAPTSQDAVYIEVWPPDVDYADLVRLIHDAKRLSSGKAIILAAYLSPFLDVEPSNLPKAESSALLATAAIAAGGGSHLLLGERDGILCDPYYPKYSTLRSSFVHLLQTYYDVLVRYGDWLVAPDITPEASIDLVLSGARLARAPVAGSVWAVATRKPGFLIVHLINLLDQTDTTWNALRTPPTTRSDLVLTIASSPPIRQVHLVSPDRNHGRPESMQPTFDDGQWRLSIPSLSIWSVIICAVDEDNASTTTTAYD